MFDASRSFQSDAAAGVPAEKQDPARIHDRRGDFLRNVSDAFVTLPGHRLRFDADRTLQAAARNHASGTHYLQTYFTMVRYSVAFNL